MQGYVKGKRLEIKLRERRRQTPGAGGHSLMKKLGHLALWLVHLVFFFKK
jgi:hypothetical protein